MNIKQLHNQDIFSDGKKVGEIIIEAVNDIRFVTFYKMVDFNTGKLRVPSGWATDQPHLSELMIVAADWEVDPDDARVILTEKTDGRKWLTTVGKFMEHGFHIDRGFGSQQALVDKHWDELLTRKEQLDSHQLGFDLSK